VTRELAIEMLLLGRLADDRDDAAARLEQALISGRVAERFARMVAALGGPTDLLDHPEHHLPIAALRYEVYPADSGIVQRIDVREVGLAVVELGGGRRCSGAAIDLNVGLSEVAALGESVGGQRPLATIHAADQASADRAAVRVRQAFRIGSELTKAPALVRKRVVLD